MSIDIAFSLPGAVDLKYDNCGVPSNWTDECDYCVADNLDSSELNNGTCEMSRAGATISS